MGFQKGNNLGGRKTKGQELALVEWYKSVLPETFKIAEEMLKSETKSDRLWAMDWLKAGLVKMIPQKIGGDPDNRTPIPLLYELHKADVHNNDSHKENTQTR